MDSFFDNFAAATASGQPPDVAEMARATKAASQSRVRTWLALPCLDDLIVPCPFCRATLAARESQDALNSIGSALL